jgi:hypothetical protein
MVTCQRVPLYTPSAVGAKEDVRRLAAELEAERGAHGQAKTDLIVIQKRVDMLVAQHATAEEYANQLQGIISMHGPDHGVKPIRLLVFNEEHRGSTELMTMLD